LFSLSLSITENGEEQGKKESTVLERERVNLENESKREKGGRGKEGIRG
jgi:hypothetical protein